jgi:predicted S18 family serine protease
VKKAIMRQLVSLLLLLSFSFAACAGEINMSLPAISGGEGLLVGITMKSVPGEGMEYVGAMPTVGTGTQESLSTAAGVARELSLRGYDCDLLVKVSDADSPGGVEGPSAGAAFTVMAYSLFSGKEPRRDAAITGAISEGGEVLPVGGLYEKAMGAKASGFDYFITPVQSVEEKLMLRGMSGIRIREVENADQAIEFFFENKIPEERPLELAVEPIENLTAYGGERVPAMGGIVDALIANERDAIAGIGDDAVREYFEARAEQHGELYGLGYDYAAANGAFLTGISASAIGEVDAPDIDAKKREVQACLDSLNKPNITAGNYEWLMGGEAREMRARRNYEKYSALEPETKDEEYLLVYQMGYSKAWCEAAKAMYAAGNSTGPLLDTNVLKDAAAELLNYTDDYGDWQEYADTGAELYGKGMYAGAIYELTFAKSMYDGEKAMEEGATQADYESLMQNESRSVWGKVFRAHSVYLQQTNATQDAYRMIVFARNMDDTAARINVVNATTVVIGGGEGCRPCNEGNLCMPAFVLLLFVFAAVGEKRG